jgi:hypothetical protein
MNSTFQRFACRLLIVCMSVLPFHAVAGMVGSGDLAAAQSTAAVRAELAASLQAYGVAADVAKDRVASLSDAEVRDLAGRAGQLPAGANGAGLGMILVAIFLIWKFLMSPDAKAEPAKK